MSNSHNVKITFITASSATGILGSSNLEFYYKFVADNLYSDTELVTHASLNDNILAVADSYSNHYTGLVSGTYGATFLEGVVYNNRGTAFNGYWAPDGVDSFVVPSDLPSLNFPVTISMLVESTDAGDNYLWADRGLDANNSYRCFYNYSGTNSLNFGYGASILDSVGFNHSQLNLVTCVLNSSSLVSRIRVNGGTRWATGYIIGGPTSASFQIGGASYTGAESFGGSLIAAAMWNRDVPDSELIEYENEMISIVEDNPFGLINHPNLEALYTVTPGKIFNNLSMTSSTLNYFDNVAVWLDSSSYARHLRVLSDGDTPVIKTYGLATSDPPLVASISAATLSCSTFVLQQPYTIIAAVYTSDQNLRELLLDFGDLKVYQNEPGGWPGSRISVESTSTGASAHFGTTTEGLWVFAIEVSGSSSNFRINAVPPSASFNNATAVNLGTAPLSGIVFGNTFSGGLGALAVVSSISPGSTVYDLLAELCYYVGDRSPV